jgi:hypothetical protein
LPEQVARYRRLKPDADERLFMQDASSEAKEDVVFEESDNEDVNVDDI